VQKEMGNEPVKAGLYDSNELTKSEKIARNGERKDGKAMTDMKTGDIHINIANTDVTNPKEVIGVAGHENIHAAGERNETVEDSEIGAGAKYPEQSNRSKSQTASNINKIPRLRR
jgi:hypothetical protein